MLMTKKAVLSNVLREINVLGDVEGSAVVTRDGLLVACELGGVDAETFAAMSATMFGAAETAFSELGKGLVDRVIVESGKAKLILMGAGSSAVLVVMVSSRVNIGLVLVEMKKATGKIEKELK